MVESFLSQVTILHHAILKFHLISFNIVKRRTPWRLFFFSSSKTSRTFQRCIYDPVEQLQWNILAKIVTGKTINYFRNKFQLVVNTPKLLLTIWKIVKFSQKQAYSEPCQTSKMKSFGKIMNG